MTVKEKVVSAIQSKDLAWHAEFERAIDQLTALGMSDPLGAALWRFKYCNDPKAYDRALALLTKKATERLMTAMPGYVRRLARAAMLEWTFDACTHCKGAGQVMAANGVMAQCTKCEGTGLKRYTDWERAQAANIPQEAWKKNERNFEKVMECLSGSSAAVGGRVRELLKS